MAITLRGSLSASHNTWSGVLWENGEFHMRPTFDITDIVDRVGAGDSFTAGHGIADVEDRFANQIRRRGAAGKIPRQPRAGQQSGN